MLLKMSKGGDSRTPRAENNQKRKTFVDNMVPLPQTL